MLMIFAILSGEKVMAQNVAGPMVGAPGKYYMVMKLIIYENTKVTG